MNIYYPGKQLIIFLWHGPMFLISFHLGEPIALYQTHLNHHVVEYVGIRGGISLGVRAILRSPV